MDKSIYDLKLHEKLNTEDMEITRVSSGWLYRFWDYEKDDFYEAITFVPFDKTFQEKTCQFRWKEGNINCVCGEKLPCSKHGENNE